MIWESRSERTADVVRDDRFLPRTSADKTVAMFIDAIRGHGNPDTVTPAQLREWTGCSYSTVRRVMRKLEWLPSGVTSSMTWNRPGVPIPAEVAAVETTAAPAPVVQLPTPKTMKPRADRGQRVELTAELDGLTIADLSAAWKVLGFTLEIHAVPVRR